MNNRSERIFLIGANQDFWFLGGASILVWFAMFFGQMFRGDVVSIEQHFVQVIAAFGLLSLVCNYPHFIISYRFGYGRGWKFIAQHWLSLIVVPGLMIGFYVCAYLNFDYDLGEEYSNLGSEILKGSIWAMYLTVGWHYSKQVFGCMMVYAKFDNYKLSRNQRRIIKVNVYSLATTNFLFFLASVYSAPDSNFFGLHLTSIDFPEVVRSAAEVFTILTGLAVVYFIFLKNYRESKVLPSLNLVVPWFAFYVWWLPFAKQPEYYFYAVPFFHSLQYLPFAYRLQTGGNSKNKFHLKRAGHGLQIAILLLVSSFAFEFIPLYLDKNLETSQHQVEWFFFISFAVFINIHHFFIDSVTWKFNQSEVQTGLFGRSHLDEGRQ